MAASNSRSQTDSLVALADTVHALARHAADAILPIYKEHLRGGDAGLEMKADRSPVTAADRAAHEVILAGLERLDPDVPVVSEEGDPEPLGDADHWLVDPLDGTKEFLGGNGEFTVNIARVDGGKPVFGLVLVPTDSRAFMGVPGQGAWQRRDTQDWTPIKVATMERGRACRVVVSRSHRGESVDDYLASLEQAGFDKQEIAVGSSLKLCQVASGHADVYPRFGPTMHWDTAAAHAVVAAAGGNVTDLQGGPLRYDSPDLRNPWFIAGGRTSKPWHEYAGSSIHSESDQ